MKTALHQQLGWYLRRPRFYPEFRRQFLSKAGRMLRRDASRQEQEAATRWCAARAVDVDTALERIAGTGSAAASFASCFPERMQWALNRARACPLKMGGPASLDLLYHMARNLGARRIVETGVAYGWSSLAFLSALETTAGHLYSTDRPYPGTDSESHAGCVVPERLKSRWHLVPLSDREAIPRIVRRLHGQRVDLCHYDSDKSIAGRSWAYPLLWDLLRPGGVFLSDDVGDNRAFQNFCGSLQQTPLIVRIPEAAGVKYAGILVKGVPRQEMDQ